MRRVGVAGALVLLGLLAAVSVAIGADQRAGLDPGYGDGGVVTLGAETDLQHSIGVSSFGPAPDGSAYVLGYVFECPPAGGCEYDYSLAHHGTGGALDKTFGGSGAVPLPQALRYSVTADEGAGLVVGFAHKGIVLRRFTAGGDPDPSFGNAGVVRFSCACSGGDHLHALVEPDGGIQLEVDHSLGEFRFENGTRVRMFRLLANGSADRSFGSAGRLSFTIRGPGAPASAVATRGGGTLIGGSGFAFEEACCGQRHIYLQKVSAKGRPDGRFDRSATRSLERIEKRGRFPTLTAVAQGSDGTISVLGYAGETGGFDLRLRADGRLDTDFGQGGVRHLPFTVLAAVAGVEGAVFAVGSPGKEPYGYTHAFRILPGGGLDPAYHRGHGIDVPVTGTRIAVTALGEGRVMVTDNGNSYCREGCLPTPAMVRFLE